jgi:uncharacterized membrane protein YgcG
MRHNGNGALTLEDARTWIEETGLCLFLPRRQFSSSVAPSFVEAVAGQRHATPDPRHVGIAEELLVRLELDGIAVRLNLLGLPGEQPDFVVAAWVLPYVYALRGDRDWRRSPQLTGSRQVSQLAVQAYKLLEAGDATIPTLKHALGREVTEGAVLRAITELWQQLRIIPVVSAPGQTAQWQLLRLRFQKAIAEGASTSQVTAISVLASIYLQAVIAACMEDVEIFLAPLTARSKVREVLRGLVATRQVHTISMGHAPHFYVAGTLPEFAVPTTVYSSSAMPAFFLHSREYEDEAPEPETPRIVPPAAPVSTTPETIHAAAEPHAPRTPAVRKPAAAGKPATPRPHFSSPRRTTFSRDRKPAQSSAGSRPSRRTGAEARPAGSRPSSARPSGARPSSARPAAGSRPAASGTRWSANGAKSANGTRKSAHAGSGTGNGSGNGSGNGARSNGNGGRNHAANGSSSARTAKPAAPAWGKHNGNGHANGAKPAPKSGTAARNGNGHKPTLAAGTKTGASKRYGFTARPKQGNKKRG